MVLAMDFRRQAQVCSRLAENCQDQRPAERFRKMANDLLAKPMTSKNRQANEFDTKNKISSGSHSCRRKTNRPGSTLLRYTASIARATLERQAHQTTMRRPQERD
jgi:hypothetical protein